MNSSAAYPCMLSMLDATKQQATWKLEVWIVTVFMQHSHLATLLIIHRYHWTSIILVRYILPSVCLRLCQFSESSFIQNMIVCAFSLPILLEMIVRICVLYLITITKSEVWLIFYCVGLGHWYALYVFSCSYKCVLWPVCFLGHSYPISFCPESAPVADIDH